MNKETSIVIAAMILGCLTVATWITPGISSIYTKWFPKSYPLFWQNLIPLVGNAIIASVLGKTGKVRLKYFAIGFICSLAVEFILFVWILSNYWMKGWD